MIRLKTHKRGDTFAFVSIFKNENDIPRVGITSQLKCQIRNDKDEFISEMSISETTTQGEYLFTVSAEQTQDWPLETLFLDIQFTDNDIVTSSETMFFRVAKDITYLEEV